MLLYALHPAPRWRYQAYYTFRIDNLSRFLLSTCIIYIDMTFWQPTLGTILCQCFWSFNSRALKVCLKNTYTYIYLSLYSIFWPRPWEFVYIYLPLFSFSIKNTGRLIIISHLYARLYTIYKDIPVIYGLHYLRYTANENRWLVCMYI